jgi:hypothetical protein
MVYGSLAEGIYRSKGLMNTPLIPEENSTPGFDYELSVLGEGWATLFSHLPFTEERLLSFERDFNSAGVSQQLKDVHAFGALALLKIEMAEGFSRLRQLMFEPPGLVKEEGRVDLVGALEKVWNLYAQANTKLGTAPIPYALFAPK